jgi:hypothetical protein
MKMSVKRKCCKFHPLNREGGGSFPTLSSLEVQSSMSLSSFGRVYHVVALCSTLVAKRAFRSGLTLTLLYRIPIVRSESFKMRGIAQGFDSRNVTIFLRYQGSASGRHYTSIDCILAVT